jgi:hypothetical protein
MKTSSMIPALPKSTTKTLRLAAVLAVLCLSFAAAAHEGHHEEQAALPAATPPPAVNADTPQVELVLKRQQDELLLYLDDYATDAPLDGLSVLVHSGSRTLQAAAAGEGVYRLPMDLLDPGAGQALQVEIHGHGIAVSVPGELPPAPAPLAATAATHRVHLPPWTWLTAAAAAVLVLLLFRLRLRRRALAA